MRLLLWEDARRKGSENGLVGVELRQVEDRMKVIIIYA